MTELGSWASPGAARRLRMQSDMVPGRADVLALIAELATDLAAPRILDLGCGHGDVSAEILVRRPDASLTVVDVSDEMLARTRDRLRGETAIRAMQHDLNEGLPPALSGPFDAVVSCFTIHNLDPARRPRLYADIRRVLRPGGLLINADRVREEGPVLQARQFDRWIEWMRARALTRYGLTRSAAEIRKRQREMDEALGDAPSSIWAMRDDLGRAGFAEIDCLYKNQITALIVAVNPG